MKHLNIIMTFVLNYLKQDMNQDFKLRHLSCLALCSVAYELSNEYNETLSQYFPMIFNTLEIILSVNISKTHQSYSNVNPNEFIQTIIRLIGHKITIIDADSFMNLIRLISSYCLNRDMDESIQILLLELSIDLLSHSSSLPHLNPNQLSNPNAFNLIELYTIVLNLYMELLSHIDTSNNGLGFFQRSEQELGFGDSGGDDDDDDVAVTAACCLDTIAKIIQPEKVLQAREFS
jgi:hypothetical protein